MQHHATDPRGFTLLEVLVALLVLSIGLLGIAAMITVQQSASGSAYWRATATQEAYNLIDRANANYIAAVNGAYVAQGTVAAPACTSNCTPAQTAAADLASWQTDVAAALPSGTGTVATQVTNGIATLTVTVSWLDNTVAGGASSSGTQHLTLVAQVGG